MVCSDAYGIEKSMTLARCGVIDRFATAMSALFVWMVGTRAALVICTSCSFTPRSLARSLAVATSEDRKHTSELQSLMRISYAVFCLKKKNTYAHLHKLKPQM